MSARPLFLDRVDAPAPIGPLLLVSDGDTLLALDFDEPEGRLRRLLRARFGPDATWQDGASPKGVVAALRAYLDGEFAALGAIPIDGGGTPFQRECWAALCEIPVGETRSYGQIAARLGKPGASRAVGLANSLNPISLIVPCHRVIGSTGALTGYGGGIERKRWLLAHERRHCGWMTISCRSSPDWARAEAGGSRTVSQEPDSAHFWRENARRAESVGTLIIMYAE